MAAWEQWAFLGITTMAIDGGNPPWPTASQRRPRLPESPCCAMSRLHCLAFNLWASMISGAQTLTRSWLCEGEGPMLLLSSSATTPMQQTNLCGLDTKDGFLRAIHMAASASRHSCRHLSCRSRTGDTRQGNFSYGGTAGCISAAGSATSFG